MSTLMKLALIGAAAGIGYVASQKMDEIKGFLLPSSAPREAIRTRRGRQPGEGAQESSFFGGLAGLVDQGLGDQTLADNSGLNSGLIEAAFA